MAEEVTDQTELYLPLVEAARLGATYAYSKEPRMTALLILTGINVVLTGTTLGVVLFGAKKMQDEVEDVKEKTNSNIRTMKRAFKNAIDDLDLEI